jgi:hypothetical protein
MTSTQLTIPQVRPRRARAARANPDALWEPGDRVVTAILIALGVVLVAIAWIGASDTTDWDTQLRWTALSMVGVVVVCVGVGVYLFRGFSQVRAEALVVRRQLADRFSRNTPSAGDDISSDRVTVAGMAHHHAPGCLLVAGKATVAADEAALAPCGVCA